ncbi:M55 family metallopeptidase [Brevibacillus daliensis]|uniref:M55 family metallopeptidase n=1 Tax=Brevibacillus daliensis TaxID=2892995 RepID=UPI001E5AFCAF|nr:M55 family metallopeptidase [Brevibacillus daliensis]
MKLFISVDMEGISGIHDWDDVIPGKKSYEFGRKMLTQDVNAAIEGAIQAGVTDILVNESHGPMKNVLVEELHPQARLIRGFFKPMCMMQGIDESFDAAFFIGYHGMAGAANAVLNHTLLGSCIQRFKLNGVEVGEAGLNAAIAGAYGVPVVLVTGDSQTAEEVTAGIPGVYTVSVKEGINAFTANSLHPTVAKNMIREQAAIAISHYKQISPIAVESSNTIEIEFKSTNMAFVVSWIPGTELLDGRTIRYQAGDLKQMIPVLQAMLLLAIQGSKPLDF